MKNRTRRCVVYKNDMSAFLAHLSYAQDELLWSLFVRRPSVRACASIRPLTFSNDFSSEALEPILLKFLM